MTRRRRRRTGCQFGSQSIAGFPLRAKGMSARDTWVERSASEIMKANAPRHVTCKIEATPEEVDAGAHLALKVRILCPRECDLSGAAVSIRAEDGAEFTKARLTDVGAGEKTYVTDEVMVTAPLTLGAHTYKAVLLANEKDGLAQEEVNAEASVIVRAHATSVNAWGMPYAIAAGERFDIKVGIKCSCGCNLAGREFRVADHTGTQLAVGKLRNEIWPGTSALYFAEVEAQAPCEVGDYTWEVESPAAETGIPHGAGSFAFTAKVVSQPDYSVTIEAFDVATRAPVKGVHVLLHPYRALTDNNGVAKLKVTKGRYWLHLSGFKYVPYQATIDAVKDVRLRAELKVEPPPSPFYPKPLEE
jgi:hypothetical protein